MNTLQTRILLGVVMFALFFGVLCLDLIFHTDIGFGCLAVLAGIIGLHEFYNIAGKNGFSPFRLSGIGTGVWLFVLYWLSISKSPDTDPQFLNKKFSCTYFWLLLVQPSRIAQKTL